MFPGWLWPLSGEELKVWKQGEHWEAITVALGELCPESGEAQGLCALLAPAHGQLGGGGGKVCSQGRLPNWDLNNWQNGAEESRRGFAGVALARPQTRVVGAQLGQHSPGGKDSG